VILQFNDSVGNVTTVNVEEIPLCHDFIARPIRNRTTVVASVQAGPYLCGGKSTGQLACEYLIICFEHFINI
jgi:hypothetical protein